MKKLNILGMDFEESTSDIEVYKVIMTRERASEIVKLNKDNPKWLNRPISKVNLRRLKNTSEQREMVLTHQGICLSYEGQIFDGQHRLTACIESGVSYETFLFIGFTKDILRFIDINKARTLSDSLVIEGVPQTSVVATVINLLIHFKKVPNTSNLGNGLFSISERVLFYKENQEAITNTIRRAWQLKWKFPGSITVSLLAFLGIIIDEIDKTETKFFLTNLSMPDDQNSGVFSEAQHPINQLRKFKGIRNIRHHLTYHIFETWNAYRDKTYKPNFYIDPDKTNNLPTLKK